MRGVGRQVSTFIKSRGFASQVAECRPSRLENLGVQLTKLPSGTIVASIENHEPLSKVALFFNAGSRHETGQNLGVTHALRAASGLAAHSASHFGTAVNIQQCGGSMDCITTRDHMIYTAECARKSIDHCVSYMLHSASHPLFLKHEIADFVANRIKLDLQAYEQDVLASIMEALHRVAFKDGMRNSLYSPKFMIGNHTAEMLQEFHSTHFTARNAALVGVGVDHEYLLDKAKELHLPETCEESCVSSHYIGGEARIDAEGPLVHAVIASQGVGIASNSLAATAVLQHALGTGASVKYSTHTLTSTINKALAEVTSHPCAATAINTTYVDTGLFGFQVVGNASEMEKILKVVFNTGVKSTKKSLSADDIKRAKQQLKGEILMASENALDYAMELGLQALTNGKVICSPALLEAVDAVTEEQVHSAAMKVMNTRPSMVVHGDLSNTPFLEELLVLYKE